MYKGMSQDVLDKYCQEVENKTNNGRSEQLKYYPPYRTRTEKLQK